MFDETATKDLNREDIADQEDNQITLSRQELNALINDAIKDMVNWPEDERQEHPMIGQDSFGMLQLWRWYMGQYQ